MTEFIFATLTSECTSDRIEVYRKGESAPLLTQKAQPHTRPYIHPILAPDGVGVLTENAPSHHPWQHGLYIGLNDVNGVGFWTEGLSGNTDQNGTFHPLPLTGVTLKNNQASWQVQTEWRDPQGKPMMTDTQDWTFTDLGDLYELDLNWQLHADVDLTFGQYQYGGLFLRMPFRKEFGGNAVTSDGHLGAEAEGKRARWVAVQMPVEGRHDHAGIAIMDHPTNLEHPVPWRVDGELGISPSCCIAGSWKLNQGQAHQFQHRVLVFNGDIHADTIEASWNRYIGRVHP